MEDVISTLQPLKWTNSLKTISIGCTNFPLIVKPTSETANTYGLSAEAVLLHHAWVVQRLVAQSMEEEGAYVVGPQMDIPSEFTGTFQYCHSQKGDNEVYSSVKEIACSLPERVFVQERLVVYPVLEHQTGSTPDKVRSMVLQPSTQLCVIGKRDIPTVLLGGRLASFGVKSKFKSAKVPCVSFKNEMTGEIISLPLTTRGKFSTMLNTPRQGRELDFKDILNEIDLPINLTTCRNCPQTLLDEHFLRPGMRLRITTIEEHEVIIGVTVNQKIVEFAQDDVEFILPQHLDGCEDKEQEIAYQTTLQRFLMECQIKNSPVNIRDYKKSIRAHVPRNVRPTRPKALNQVASSRVSGFSRRPNFTSGGLSAIQLLVSSSNGIHQRSSLRISDGPLHPRIHGVALPSLPNEQKDVPPLPPRNSLRMRHLLSPKRTRSKRAMSYAAEERFDDFPTRPPPLPPAMESLHDSVGDARPTNFSAGDGLVVESRPPAYPPVDEVASSPAEIPWKSFAAAQASSEMVEERSDFIRSHSKPTVGILDFFADDPTPSAVDSLSEADPKQVWESLDEYCSQRQRASMKKRNAAQDVPAYENVDPTGAAASKEEEEVPGISEFNELFHDDIQLPDETSSLKTDVEMLGDAAAEYRCRNKLVQYEHTPDDVSVSSGDRASEARTEGTSLTQSPAKFHFSEYAVTGDEAGSSFRRVSVAFNYIQPPQDWQPPEDLVEMSVKEVADTLRYIGMSEDTVEWFCAEKVDGRLLCGLEKELLAEHFRLTPFQQQKIALFLQGWRPKLT